MAWDESSVLDAGETVGFGGTLWILHLAVNSDVGIGRTSDFDTEAGSVRSFTKRELGLGDPGIPTLKDGYTAISRRRVADADGNRDVINNKDKTTRILRLTTLGKNLMKVVDSDEEVRMKLGESVGAEIDRPTKPWWPGEGPHKSFPVRIQTFADRAVREAPGVSIQTVASFECDRCGATVEHEYWVELTAGNIAVGEWSRFVSTDCSCGLTYRHPVADPRQPPTPE